MKEFLHYGPSGLEGVRYSYNENYYWQRKIALFNDQLLYIKTLTPDEVFLYMSAEFIAFYAGLKLQCDENNKNYVDNLTKLSFGVAKEKIYEEIRENTDTNLPSRIKCVYGLDLSIFKNKAKIIENIGITKPEYVWYRCKPIVGKQYITSYYLLEKTPRNFVGIKEQAEKYWNYKGNSDDNADELEILFEGKCIFEKI